MGRELLIKARAYARRHGLTLVEVVGDETHGSLGGGIDGTVWRLKSKINPADTALKIHRETEAFHREVRCYERLRERDIYEVNGFVVPDLLRADADQLALEMNIVSPPFLLDFATAYLDAPPDFSGEAWEEWAADKAEQFGERWETVVELLDRLKVWGIYMLDPSPNNIRFE